MASRPQRLGRARTSLSGADDRDRVVVACVRIGCRDIRHHRLAHLSG
jgi:hypothetical protein